MEGGFEDAFYGEQAYADELADRIQTLERERRELAYAAFHAGVAHGITSTGIRRPAPDFNEWWQKRHGPPGE